MHALQKLMIDVTEGTELYMLVSSLEVHCVLWLMNILLAIFLRAMYTYT